MEDQVSGLINDEDCDKFIKAIALLNCKTIKINIDNVDLDFDQYLIDLPKEFIIKE